MASFVRVRTGPSGDAMHLGKKHKTQTLYLVQVRVRCQSRSETWVPSVVLPRVSIHLALRYANASTSSASVRRSLRMRGYADLQRDDHFIRVHNAFITCFTSKRRSSG